MIYSIKGKLSAKQENYFVIEVGGVSFKIVSSLNDLRSAPAVGEIVSLFTYLHVREDVLELYGFLYKDELEFFEMLIGISGIGPKSALGILSVESVDKLKAAIAEGRAELLTKASGVGKKTAERVILELRGKLGREGTGQLVGIMESDQDITEILVNLGYTKYQAKDALSQIDSKLIKIEERIKAALKILKK
ncbi:MAG: Holliday junction branch migration protein RuvA [Patescibacteria group bacterium]